MKAKPFKLLIFFLAIFSISYKFNIIYNNIPKEVYIYPKEENVIELNIPVTGTVKETKQVVDFSKPVVFQADTKGDYSIDLKLFDIFKIHSSTLKVIDNQKIYAGGFPIGLYLKMNGVFVIDSCEITDCNNNSIFPCKDKIISGDYIVMVDDIQIKNKKQLVDYINNCNGNDLILTIIRNNEYINETISPVLTSDGTYKIGIWIKDDSQGIGTLTYIDKDGNYGALGHGINDNINLMPLNIDKGFLYKTHILSITKGEKGNPGEYVGEINYSPENLIGNILENRSNGIYGNIKQDTLNAMINSNLIEEYDIGLSYNVHKGNAIIRVYVDNEIKDYEIIIKDINFNDDKNITFECVSDELIEKTNGIVQGMSGSPIIQDGKIIGAVTHVFINDSTKGYGIFIEKMIND